ncbi:ribonuclease III domain-containing protein, partial [Haemophilus parainfluenzae]|uniref:ribonuclease III domain-containing protein n=1 Tax=Haemophilus parainfluenzae TaxID=729 RepID=UPI001CEDD060
ILQHLTPLLTPAEQDLLRRGRNASSRGPRRLDPLIYQQASSFETLLGYLYLTNPERLTELFGHIQLKIGSVNQEPTRSDKL